MTHSKRCTVFRVSRVKQCAVGQDDTHRTQHAVTIGVYTAAHTASVVHHNTTDHSRFEAGRVWREVLAVWAKNLIDTLSYNTWLQGNRLCFRLIAFGLIA